jgi:hypothetical protein
MAASRTALQEHNVCVADNSQAHSLQCARFTQHVNHAGKLPWYAYTLLKTASSYTCRVEPCMVCELLQARACHSPLWVANKLDHFVQYPAAVISGYGQHCLARTADGLSYKLQKAMADLPVFVAPEALELVHHDLRTQHLHSHEVLVLEQHPALKDWQLQQCRSAKREALT